MPSIQRNALVPYSAEQMFDLVNDVDKYQEFLPGCEQSTVLHQSDTEMKASMVISKVGVKQTLTTLNQLERGKFIKMDLSDGPFKTLNGGWTFTALSDEACKIELKLNFIFSNKLMEMAIGKVFNSLANSMVSAFSQRAKEVYR
ncbi:type II toxin-antitoxin system RatA family toxin [Glaciecola sp. KUL10]|uniref:type II toxin-antitoxin system RatA family toxin n=1 Tax=Glaciecola sp. (strain KUL10) TaxID=2161813 RepID=UPI000D787E14|nr:type II toxin-antitoxin system RatA family toxin [Glaciecola sp. KUL10]GBL03141.1 oligoketide cyclase/lipid transport protein [Glaciecola sp. KUL10]